MVCRRRGYLLALIARGIPVRVFDPGGVLWVLVVGSPVVLLVGSDCWCTGGVELDPEGSNVGAETTIIAGWGVRALDRVWEGMRFLDRFACLRSRVP
jgi:hypothetical protein